MANAIQLIVGLGNPGAEYAKTRHNAGFWFVEQLAHQQGETLRQEAKFFGLAGKASFSGEDCRLLLPTTYMNRSGQAVVALANFYRIPAEAILVVHDELDLPVGTIRLKQGGGDGGHNGLKDISARLNNKSFWRLRIGIDHPGQRERVHDHVLSQPSKDDQTKIFATIDAGLAVLPTIVSGEIQKAMQQLHTN